MKTIDMAQFLNESTIELHTLERWIEQRWIVPLDATARVEISETDAARAMKEEGSLAWMQRIADMGSLRKMFAAAD